MATQDPGTCANRRPGLVLEVSMGMRSTLLALLALTILPLTSCNLYFAGGDDDDDPCDVYPDWGGGDGLQEPPPLLRNPQSGLCESFGWGNPPYPCNGSCGPCAADTDGSSTPPVPPSGEPSDAPEESDSGADAAQAPIPTWGYCDSYCSGLDEPSCLATDGCRGIFDDEGNTGAGEFRECWQTDASPPPPVQTCEGLDAFTCSQLDNCIAVHEFACPGDGGDREAPGLIPPPCEAGYFIACHDEEPVDGCYSDQDCGQGFSCNAAEVCLPPPGGDCAPDGPCDLPAVCYGTCVLDTDPGECDGEVACRALPPQCEAGTTPGIANGCWTGLCIDLSTCPQASCGDIVGESMCIARDDCSPYYVGVDCSCTPDGCDCSEWNFDTCASGV